MAELVIYATPPEAEVSLYLDDGRLIVGVSQSVNGRGDAHVLALPPEVAAQGSTLSIVCVGYQPFGNRGIVSTDEDAAIFILDDVHLTPVEAAPSPTPPPVPQEPAAVIQAVYDTGDHDLSTHDGCGRFTEACCTELHAQDPMWGHIRKTGGQNQYNGHAVDAVYLLAGSGAGVYDIIHDSVSPNASPQCLWKDAGDPELWYYPTGHTVGAYAMVQSPRLVESPRGAAPKRSKSR
jgi:hypothetical protein